MITLQSKQELILSFIREGLSLRAIARKTGLHRSTIKKYVEQYEERRDILRRDNELDRMTQIDIIDEIVTPPKYNGTGRPKRKVTDEIAEKVTQFLEENKRKREMGLSKQQKKKIDIHEALVAVGCDISYSTVKHLVNQLSQQGKEAYIRQEYEPGDICEFDWGEVKIWVNGELIELQLAVMAAAKSNYRWAKLFPRQNTGCFLEAHAEFFDHIGGTYQTMVYDNMRVAVRKFVGKTEKEPTDALLKLSMYYGFRFRFCNIRAGWEKGHVERSVEYVRRKAFAFRSEFASIEEANEYLLQTLGKLNQERQTGCQQTIGEVFEEEKPYLMPAMPRYETAKSTHARVDKYATISVDTCYYSVPDHLVGKLVFVKVYSFRVVCYFDGQMVASHSKLHGQYQWSIQLEHYLKTLKKKPGALAGSVALRQSEPFLQDLYAKYYNGKERDFIELILYCQEVGWNTVKDAIKVLEGVTPLNVSTEKIKALSRRNPAPVSVPKNESLIDQTSAEQLNQYRLLLDTGGANFVRTAIL